jgi:hypothetical protein
VQRERHEEQSLHPDQQRANLGHGVVEIALSVVRRVAQQEQASHSGSYLNRRSA